MKVALTPWRFLERTERLFPDKTAIVCGESRISFEAYGRRVRQLSRALGRMGAGSGDRVAYLGMNCHRLLELYFAVLPGGVILTPMNVRLHPDEMAFILNDLEAKVLFVDDMFANLAASLVPKVPSLERVVLASSSVPSEEGWLAYETILAAEKPDPIGDLDVDEDQTAEIFYTSGTTGRPKGVMLTHRNLYLHALQNMIALGLSDATVQIVGTVPLFHVNAWGTPQYAVAAGSTQVVVPRFDPESFLSAVERERATFGMMVPAMLGDLTNFEGAERFDTSSLERIMIGGAPPPYSLLRAASKKFGCEIQVGYGLTETCPVISVATLKSHRLAAMDDEERYRRMSMTGLPLIGVEIKVIGDDGAEVAWDGKSMGEIVVRGDVVTKGYWKRPEETAEAFRGGYFHTGDVATVDSEGYLQIVDRKKDIIISGGENISSVEVEDALYSHPDVRECAVIGIPDERFGERPFAFVVRKAEGGASQEDLIRHVRERIAKFKAPAGIRFVEGLPRTG